MARRPYSDLVRHLERITRDPDAFAQALTPEMVALSLEAEARAKVNATSRPRVRSGRLRQSIQGLWDPTRERLVLRSGGRAGGGSVRYARAQDMGAVIRPTRTQYLAIPLDAVKTGAGVARYDRARNDPTPMHARKSKRGNLLLHDDVTGEPRWLLTKGPIRIPATRFLTDAGDWMRRQLPDALDRTLTRLLTPR